MIHTPRNKNGVCRFMTFYYSAPDALREDKARLDLAFYGQLEKEPAKSFVRAQFNATVADELKRVMVQEQCGRMSDQDRDAAMARFHPTACMSRFLAEVTECHDPLLDFRYAVACRMLNERPELFSAKYATAKILSDEIVSAPPPNLIDRTISLLKGRPALDQWHATLPTNVNEPIAQQDFLLSALKAHEKAERKQRKKVLQENKNDLFEKAGPVIRHLYPQQSKVFRLRKKLAS